MRWFLELTTLLLVFSGQDLFSAGAFSSKTLAMPMIRTTIGDKVRSYPQRQVPLDRPSELIYTHAGASSPTAVAVAPAAATAAAAVASAAPVPPLKAVALACLLPTLMGYWKSEYGVSYAYGTAVASVAFMVLRSLPKSSVFVFPTSIAACHAAAVLFYGIRLNLFLLYRELFVPRFAKMRERIEERAKKRGSRLSRTPFILSCALLYGFMSAPMLVTRKICGDAPLLLGQGGYLNLGFLCTTSMAWFGFLLGAIGDMAKSLSKAKNGEDHLVTGGVFSIFRHPNYTGEAIGWTSSCVTAFLAILFGGGKMSLWKQYLPYLTVSVFGLFGITTVLSAATANLESRQKEQYGDAKEYKDWVKGSWVGVCFSRSYKSSSAEAKSDDGETGIELNVSDEAEGTGI
jgi:steroid 5-alpha reductase family enzyme